MTRKLLFSVTRKDFDISYFSGTGPGGTNRNKHQNCVRMTHRDSGACATAQRQRSKPQNEREAFLKVVESPKFKVWHAQKAAEALAQQQGRETVNELVLKSMRPDNLKLEVKSGEGLWTDGGAVTQQEVEEACSNE